MLIKTVLIEDDQKNVQVLENLIQRLAEDLQVNGHAGHVAEAVALIESTMPDLVFMDIQLADGTCFDVLKKLSFRNFSLIIVTAYDHYALEAIRYAAVDYLLKPIGIAQFEEAVSRARNSLSLKVRQQTIESLIQNLGQPGGQGKKISISTLNGYEFIETADIVWCQSDSSYTVFYLADKTKIVSSRNIGYYEEVLDANSFCRIHHGTIIHLRFIKSYRKGKIGIVVMSDGTELEIAQRRKGAFLDKLAL
ncbi:LytTR family DNA-binding domain-containing protein [Paraflavitalea sp. CAU 1676]|uniref:LytR/AlgR family response regulator transcription factor n=1 Tax=Paraflavitalea sp. CAU 1676 TaxID=3032598 RepID=UPI0023DAB2B8|nr:LytTR family DNA-binding domain-containing protein [Paraflavitalea sp. CAU 1676]MDF2190420.1 LytTR family DNA-binding domain-containing protein [Paraflavitalea sp. CAU 1676]